MTDLPEAERRSREVAAALVDGKTLQSADLQLLRTHLVGYVRQKFPHAGADVALEIVDEGLARFSAAIQTPGRVTPAAALAYLRSTVRNGAVDWFRSDRRDRPLEEASYMESDDAVARLLEHDATVQLVEQILRDAAQRKDTIATRVINAYLNLVEAHGTLPSTRDVATEADVSHTTVSNVLRRLRESLQGDGLPD